MLENHRIHQGPRQCHMYVEQLHLLQLVRLQCSYTVQHADAQW